MTNFLIERRSVLETRVILGTVFMAGFLLPYVFLEPAPVDIVMAVLPFLIITRTRKLNRKSLQLAGIYLAFSIFGIFISTTFIDVRPEVLIPYCVVQVFLLISTLSLYELFRSSLRALLTFLKGYIIGAIVSSVIVLLMHYLNFGGTIIYRDEFAVRIKGFFKDPNVLGPFLIMPVAALVFCRSELGFRRSSIFLGVPLFLLLALTYSRAAMGGLLITLLFTFLMSIRTGFRLKHAVYALLAVSSLMGVLFLEQERISVLIAKMEYLESRLSLQGYDAHRLLDIIAGLELGFRNPFGIGPGIFGKMFDTSNPHNLFVGKLVDVGFVPAAMMIWLLVYATALSTRFGVSGRDKVLLVMSGTLFTHIVVSMVIYSHHWRHMLFLCVAAIAYSAHMRYTRTSEIGSDERGKNSDPAGELMDANMAGASR